MAGEPRQYYGRQQYGRPLNTSGHTTSGEAFGHSAGHAASGDTLRHWIAQQELSHSSGSWDLYQSRGFADLWYGARAAGEHVRGLALERLYRNRPHPGGAHPDPREPGVFSRRAVLSMTASLLDLNINPAFLDESNDPNDPNDPNAVNTSLAKLANMGTMERIEKLGLDEETLRRFPPAWLAWIIHGDRFAESPHRSVLGLSGAAPQPPTSPSATCPSAGCPLIRA